MGALLGGIAGGVLGLVGANAQNQANAAMVNQQEQFQENMADTQYQRTVQDMSAAGLNPMMMFQGGGGLDASPTGSTMQMVNTLQGAANSASTVAQNMASLDNTEQDTENKNTQGLEYGWDVDSSKYKSKVLQAQALMANDTYDSAVNASNAANELSSAQSRQGMSWLTYDKILGHTGNAAAGLNSALGVFKYVVP